jgi:RNA polymerase sigma factor (sigma-70 family)
MPTSPMSRALHRLRSALLLAEGADLTDEHLLDCFVSRREPGALEALVRRHGPMVWGVCRRTLRNHHDAEDAFQATFLVLARKAASIHPGAKVANWLYGVARQTALKARATRARRARRERPVTDMPEPAAPGPDPRSELRPLLDQELSRLPEKYRTVLVLCGLEGKAVKEAARQLGCPPGTVASRLARGRALLAKRLARHGLAVSAATLGAALSPKAASACVPAAVLSSTTRAMTACAAGQAAAGMISARVAALTQETVQAMFLTKLKIATAVVLAAGALTFSAGTFLAPPAVGWAAAGEKEKGLPRAEAAGVAEPVGVQLLVAGPPGMRVSVWAPTARGGKVAPVEVPGRVNLEQGKRFRLKLTDIPGRPGVERFPTVEIPGGDAAAEPFLTNSAIPVEFTDRDFDQVSEGKMITKVVYLGGGAGRSKSAGSQGVPITRASYEYSDRDVLEEARQRGTVLAVVRMGDIDLGSAAGKGREQATLPLEKADKGKLLHIEIGNDGVQGRVLPLGKDSRADQLASQLEHFMRYAATFQAEHRTLEERFKAEKDALRQRLKSAEVEIRSLQDALERAKQEAKKAKPADGK